jgi:hypothetical protein
MSVIEVMKDLTRFGIRLECHGEQLRFSPQSAVSPELRQRMTAHKGELLAILKTDRDRPPAFFCPWCRSPNLVDDSDGLRCDACDRLAWLETDVGITRADVATDIIDEVDLLTPCSTCGTLELWQTLVGNWRCQRCDPPTTARQLRQMATRLRMEHT